MQGYSYCILWSMSWDYKSYYLCEKILYKLTKRYTRRNNLLMLLFSFSLTAIKVKFDCNDDCNNQAKNYHLLQFDQKAIEIIVWSRQVSKNSSNA